MAKSHPKSRSERRKQKAKRLAKASMGKPNWATKIGELLDSMSQCGQTFFLRLWNPVRKLFNFWPSDGKKEPSSSSLEGPGAASSSAAVATPSEANVANGAIEEQAVERLSNGTVYDNDEDPGHAPNLTGISDEVSKPDPEAIDEEFSSSPEGGVDGGIVRVGYHRKGEAEVELVKRLQEIVETKPERTGSDSESWEQMKEKVNLRQAWSNYEKTNEFKVMNKEMKKEVLNILKRGTWNYTNFNIVLDKTSYTKILRMMHFQGANMAQESSFERIKWRKDHRFPLFKNDDPEYKWWLQNFQPEKLKKRFQILREAAKKWNPEIDIFLVIEVIAETNSTLHPEIEMGLVEMCQSAKTIRSCGDKKI